MTRTLLPAVHLPRLVKPKGVRRIVTDWVDQLDPLEAENARLLLRQQVIDRRADLRALDEWDREPEYEPNPNYGGFLHAVCFDRPDDAWPFYAARATTRKSRAMPGLK